MTPPISYSNKNSIVQPTNYLFQTPKDILIKIFTDKILGLKELASLMQTSKHLKNIILDQIIGREYIQLVGKNLIKNEPWMKTYKYWLDNTHHNICVDTSGSMTLFIQQAIRKTKEIAQKILPVYRMFTFYRFSNNFNRKKIHSINDIKTPYTGGGTDLSKPLNDIIKKHNKEKSLRTYIDIITDGDIWTNKNQTLEHIQNSLWDRRSEIHISIHIVGDSERYKSHFKPVLNNNQNKITDGVAYNTRSQKRKRANSFNILNTNHSQSDTLLDNHSSKRVKL